MRIKSTILFSKNDILLKKTEGGSQLRGGGLSDGYNIIRKDVPGVSEEGEEIKLSPLGFYYKRKYCRVQKPRVDNETKRRIIAFSSGGVDYEISYYTKLDNVEISSELRPYEFTKGMEEHFIYDLKEELDKLFAIIEDNKLCKDPKEKKKSVYKDIFGNPEGIITPSNEIKILNHGFDLKTSFRKRKEDK